MKTAFVHELKQAKWPLALMFVLALSFLNTTAKNLDGLYGRNLADMDYGMRNYFICALPSGLFLLFLPLVFLVMKQLGAAGWDFLFTLPLKKKELLALKLAAGVLSLSITVLFFGAGLFYLYECNRPWMDTAYLELPRALDSYGSILTFLFFLWCFALVFYLFAFFIGLLVSNKAAAAVIACAGSFYPFLTLELIFDAFEYPPSGLLRPFRDFLKYFEPFFACHPFEFSYELLHRKGLSYFALVYDWRAAALYLGLFILLAYGCLRLIESPRLINPQGFVIIPLWEKIFCVLFALGVSAALAQICSMLMLESPLILAVMIIGFLAGIFGGRKFLGRYKTAE